MNRLAWIVTQVCCVALGVWLGIILVEAVTA